MTGEWARVRAARELEMAAAVEALRLREHEGAEEAPRGGPP